MDLDEFSDDGLDDLPDNALQQLEHNAIQFTQAQPQAALQHKPPSQQAQTNYPECIWIEDDDLDTTEVTNAAGAPIGRPVIDNTLQQHQRQQQPQREHDSRRSLPPVPNPRWNPTVDPAKRAPSALPSRPRTPSVAPPNQPVFFGSQRFAGQTSGLNRAQASQFARPAIQQNRFAPSQTPQSQSGDIVNALQQRVRALEAELNATRGEVSIIRSNSTKAQQQHDAEVSRLKKINAEQLAKQERIAEAAMAAQQNANTELQFLQRDMREVSDRARRKDTGAGTGIGTTTPKKNTKQWRVADGFDEMDIVISPSKSQGRSKNTGSIAANVGDRTPSKGKRKRPVVDSPIMPLEIHMGDVDLHHDKAGTPGEQPKLAINTPPPPFDFLPLILDHGCFHDQPPTFDTLSRFAFPSDPTTSFSTKILQTLPLMGRPSFPMQLLVDFSEHMISLWVRCRDESYWAPVKYLVSLISFTFHLHATEVAPFMIETLIPVAQSTICIVAEWRHRLLESELSTNQEYQILAENVDTTSILGLVHSAALTCATAMEESEPGFESRAVRFWKLVSFDLVIVLLTPKQLLTDILGMLELLTTSSLPNSIGPIMEEKDPSFVARVVIERVAAKLTEFPRAATTPAQRRTLRLAALRTLIAFARHPFGAIQLASHSTALPRLVTCLSACIDELYDQPLGPKSHPLDDTTNPDRSPTDELCRIVSQSVALIHTLITGPQTSAIADISQKLSGFHGASQRYLIALGRLAFAEDDLVIEAGIDIDTSDMASELLEMAVTPDEAKIISEAFNAKMVGDVANENTASE